MPALANPKWEQFCLLLVQGKNATQAYILAGYGEKKTAPACASRLQNNVKVRDRLVELREQSQAVALERHEITLDDLIRMAVDLYKAAKNANQLGAGVAALKELGILTGKRVERREVGGPGDFDRMSDDELRAFIAIDVTPESGGEERIAAPGVEEAVRE